MDDKTEELRDIFIDVADDPTVTEEQEETPGTLAGDRAVTDRLTTLIEERRDHAPMRTSFDTETLIRLAREFYEGASDEAIASDLDVDTDDIREARLDLHLVTEEDRTGPLPFDSVRHALAKGKSLVEMAENEDLPPKELEPQWEVAEVESRMRRLNYRFRDEFDDLLGDGDLAEHLTDEITDDGLEDATDGLEVDTAF